MIIKNVMGIIAIGSIALLSCNDKSEKSTEVITDTVVTTPVAAVAKQASTEGTSVKISTADVPDTIRTGFEKKYPKAQRVEWMSYQPVENDDLPMDDRYYYVRFNNSGADYTTWYNNRGDWVKTATKIPGNSKLPDAVNKYINANYPDYTIEEISKENDKDMDMYEIKLNKGENKVKLKILPNGEVFKKKVK